MAVYWNNYRTENSRRRRGKGENRGEGGLKRKGTGERVEEKVVEGRTKGGTQKGRMDGGERGGRRRGDKGKKCPSGQIKQTEWMHLSLFFPKQ